MGSPHKPRLPSVPTSHPNTFSPIPVGLLGFPTCLPIPQGRGSVLELLYSRRSGVSKRLKKKWYSWGKVADLTH